MEKLFGLSMNVVMVALLAIFLAAMAGVAVMAVRNRIMVKLGLRNIPRRKTQTILIIVGVMLSTVIMSAAFGTGDTLSYSIRSEVIKSLGTIDEVIISAKAGAGDSFGDDPYFGYERFQQLQAEVGGLNSVDGLNPQIARVVPTIDLRTSQSEGQMRVVGVDTANLQGFGAFTLTSGGEVRLEDLAPGEAYINDRAAEELDALAGDEVRLFGEDEAVTLTVKGVVNQGGLAGRDPTLLLPLSRAQELFGRPGQINLMLVSNRGGLRSGVEHSEEVTRRLRNLYADRAVAARLKELLNQERFLRAIEVLGASQEDSLKRDLARLGQELKRPEVSEELVSLLADQKVADKVLGVVNSDRFKDVFTEAQREVSTLFAELADFRVEDIKRDALEFAELAGSFATTFFVTFSMFSIAVGVLLIFLIFVMLAAARRSEMGMARAVGARRGHLVQMFVYEGTAYALASAAVGVILGLGASAIMVTVLNRIITRFDEDFQLIIHFEPRSAIVAYCLGMAITLATVTFSAYRVSRLNIVAAVRGLSTTIPASATGWRDILLAPWRACLRPFKLSWQGVVALATAHPLRAGGHVLRALWAAISVPGTVLKSVAQVLTRLFLQGWLTLLLGLLLAVLGVSRWERDSPFTAGVSLMIIGLGLILRTALRRTPFRPEVRDRIAFTSMGVAMLIFWTMPYETLEPLTGQLQGDIDMMFVSAVFMVTAAVITVMYNADLLVKALSFATGGIGRLRPALVTAIAYPMSARFRTGLTLGMFALVIFTLMVMSILTESFASSVAQDAETVWAGWDVEGRVNFNNPVADMRGSIAANPDLRIEDFEAIGGYTWLDVEARQLKGKLPQWEGSHLLAADVDYIGSSSYKLKLIADGYGTTAHEVWEHLVTDPSLAVIGGWLLPTRASPNSESGVWVQDLYYEDHRMSPIDIEVREPRTGQVLPLKVIAVLDRQHSNFWGMIVSKEALDDAIPFPVPVTNYRFRVADGLDSRKVAKGLEAAFVEHGMETVDLEEELKKDASAGRAFSRLFVGFLGMGLLVGIAALGVVSSRAVVERRQQIGVLRAIGYRRGMIHFSFLLEFSFIALLGVAIGVIGGIILSYHAISDIRAEEAEANLRLTVPWLQIALIVLVTYLFSLLATFIPARQASRIYPAEALRYE